MLAESHEELLTDSQDDLLTETSSVEGDSFKDIQDAVDNANDEDTIYLNGKTYIGNGTQININKSITIDGSSSGSDSKAIIDANDSSRAFYINGAYNIVLKNIIFQKLKIASSGGAIYQTGGNLSIINCEVKDINVSTGSVTGGIIYMDKNSNLFVDTFEAHNIQVISANFNGFIFCVLQRSKANLSNVKCYNNTIAATSSRWVNRGGIGYVDSYCEVTLNNLSVCDNVYNSNYKELYGGIICNEAFNNVNMDNIQFANNKFKSVNNKFGGGFIFSQYNSTIYLANCNSTNNDMYSKGIMYAGLISNTRNCNVTLNNISCENDVFSCDDYILGTICRGSDYCNYNITNINILNVNASSNDFLGGFFYFTKGTKSYFENITFTGNNINSQSYVYGMITSASDSISALKSINFFNNAFNVTGNIFGGGILITGNSNVSIQNLNFTYNKILNASTINGILLRFDGININVINVTIENNRLNSEIITGGFMILSGNDYVANIKVNNNVIVNDGKINGAILYFSGNNVTLKNLTMDCNNISCENHSGIIVTSKNTKFNMSNIEIIENNIYNDIVDFNDPFYKMDTGNGYGMMRLEGCGTLFNANISHNHATNALGIALQAAPYDKSIPIIIDSCIFTNNTSTVTSKDHEVIYYMNHGGAICVSGGADGFAIIKNCLFVNNSNSQGGAMTPHNNCIVENCRFINNTATKFYGGAISTEDGLVDNNANITIRGCYFENNAAPIGGAIQAKGDYVKIYNCTFKENKAVQGGAVFLEGNNLTLYNCTFIDNNATDEVENYGVLIGQTYLPQVSSWDAFGGAVYIHGDNAKLRENIFKYNSAITPKNASLEDKGGAIYIFGDNATVLTSYFDDNFAHSGNGSAIYIMGINANIDLSEFYNHDAGRGTVFIRGSYANVLNSIFRANTASKGGAGIYIIGNYSLVKNVTFENNNATVHGGAIHTQGDYIKILNSRFISNNAHPSDDELDNGLGGAIYTKGDFNDIAYCDFDFNTARNGSAIYNRGANLTIEDCEFHYNQAYSYHLEIKVEPRISDYTPNNKIVINITHIGGDNIINAIYNDGSYKNIFFYNVTYEHSSMSGGKINSGLEKVNPVESAEKSNNGKLIYQDSREDLQIIDVVVAREVDNGLLGASEISGDVIKQFNGRTGIYGNISFTLTGDLKPGKYNVYASHPDDRLYKGIENSTRFEISPQVNLEITKDSDRDSYFVGDIATYTITVKSLGTDAHNVKIDEILPEGMEIDSYTASKGEFGNNVWYIETLESKSSETLTVKVKLTTNGTFTNVVNVTSVENDTDPSDNIANKTITVKNYVDLTLTKTASNKKIVVGEEVIWTITVTNNGILNATGVHVTDKLPKSLKYLSYTSSKGRYSPDAGIWDIGDVEVNETVTLNITTKVLSSGKIVNSASVTSNEEDKNTTNNRDSDTIEATEEVEPIKKKNPDKKDKTSKKNKTGKKDNPGKNDKSNRLDDSVQKGTDKNEVPVKQSETVTVFDKNATGNPIILLILSLAVIPLRKIKKY